MIVCIWGNVGTGKTILETFFLKNSSIENRHIYANYQLNFPFTPIRSIEDLIEIKTRPNAIGIDEAWISADSNLNPI